MNEKILIIEDETRIAHWLKAYFERAGFVAEVAAEGTTGLAAARTLQPDLVILDLMLPGLDGMQVCQVLRRSSAVPIIMLTAKGAPQDRIAGLDRGADDYVTKPFDPDEVVARAKAVLRRAQGKAQTRLRVGAIELDETTHEVTVNTQPVTLSRAQFAILSVLMRHPNQVFSRAQLIDAAFAGDFAAFDRAIDTHIRRLRKQLQRQPDGPQPIQTIYGEGYKLVSEAD